MSSFNYSQISTEHKIIPVDNFVEASRHVADDHQAEKKITFPGGILHPDGLDDGKRPTDPEANQHDKLEDTEVHSISFQLDLSNITSFPEGSTRICVTFA